jgi:hypothetical protein
VLVLPREHQERDERIQARKEMGLEPETDDAYTGGGDTDPFTTNLLSIITAS